MNEYIEPAVDPETAAHDNHILARIAQAEHAIDQANAHRMERLAHYRLTRTVRAWTIAALLGALLWFATEAGWL